jgi:hypothetical protein
MQANFKDSLMISVLVPSDGFSFGESEFRGFAGAFWRNSRRDSRSLPLASGIAPLCLFCASFSCTDLIFLLTVKLAQFWGKINLTLL